MFYQVIQPDLKRKDTCLKVNNRVSFFETMTSLGFCLLKELRFLREVNYPKKVNILKI